MRTISPYTAAAILILSRIFAYGLYIPAGDEYPTVTALGCLLLTAVRLVLLLPVIIIFGKQRKTSPAFEYGKAASLFLLAVSAAALMTAGISFCTLTSTVYPDRLSSLGVPVVWFAACAYVASMGLPGTARSSGFMVFAFIGVIILTFVGLRHHMLSDRVYIYSEDMAGELAGVLTRLCRGLFDIPIIYGLLPHISHAQGRSAWIYLITDALLSVLIFFMYASMLGSFKSEAGYSMFTLFSCTEGILIDRSDGIFVAILSASGIITCASLLIIIKDCIRKFCGKFSDVGIISAAAVTAAVALAAVQRDHAGGSLYGVTAVVSSVALAFIVIIKSALMRSHASGGAKT